MYTQVMIVPVVVSFPVTRLVLLEKVHTASIVPGASYRTTNYVSGKYVVLAGMVSLRLVTRCVLLESLRIEHDDACMYNSVMI